MTNVLDITIDPDIVLDEKRLTNSNGKVMPIAIQDNIKVTMTIVAQRYECHWSELTWNVKFDKGQPIISVKRKP